MSWQPVPGVRLAATSAGLYAGERLDLAVLELAPGTESAGVFTTNRFCAAPVEVAREHLEAASPRLLLINAGCANAGLGEQGLEDTRLCCEAAAGAFAVEPHEVLPFSTGVIGERLDVGKIQAQMPQLQATLSADGWPEAAQAILTTDTRSKLEGRRVKGAGKNLHVTGMAKGAGMICPDMATMLAFVATDLAVDAAVLEQVLERALEHSFHAITVEGDTSTNDACILLATGASGVNLADLEDSEVEAWEQAVFEVCETLAKAIVRDAEGATRFITIEVEQAATPEQAQAVARAVAHSPLVKTAAFAGDPNWGRILAAVGRSVGELSRMDRVGIRLDDVQVVTGGAVAENYREEQGCAVMARDEFTIRVDLGLGESQVRLYTSDLSYDYVKINAEYRT